MENYIGQKVMIQRQRQDGTVDHLSGQHICIEQVGPVVYCVSTASAFDGREIRKFNLNGTEPWIIEPRGVDLDLIEQFIVELDLFLQNGASNNRMYVESAYLGIPAVIRGLLAVYTVETEKEELLGEFLDSLERLSQTIEEAATLVEKSTKKGKGKKAPAQAENSVASVFNALKEGKLPPVPNFVLVRGPHCEFCDLQDTCPAK